MKDPAPIDRRHAYFTMDRDEAVKLFPDIANVYMIENNARVFLQQNRSKFNQEAEAVFIDEVRESCFDELERGRDIGKRLHGSTRTNAIGVAELEYGD